MTSSNRTPADLTISPRDRDFGRKTAMTQRWWMRGDPMETAIMNALSATFPEGERFFIESVVHYKDAAVEPLKSQVKAFVRQEAMHTREHIAFNEHITNAGYDITGIEARTVERLTLARSRHPIAQLAVTVAMEHFTAILANDLLGNKKRLEGAEAEIANLWRWHSIEEIEHKSVAFDVYMAATKSLTPFKRWSIRTRIMVLTTNNFFRSMTVHVQDLLKQDGIDPKTQKIKALKVLFGKNGMLKGALGHYLAFYMPGFHPWKVDDRKLIADAELSLGAVAA